MKCLSEPAVVGRQLCNVCVNPKIKKMVPAHDDNDTPAKSKQSLALLRAKEILSKSKMKAQQLASAQASVSLLGPDSPHPSNTSDIKILSSSTSNPYEIARSKRVSPSPYPTGPSRNARSSKPKAPATSKGAIPSSNPPKKVLVQCGFEVRAGGKFHTKLSKH